MLKEALRIPGGRKLEWYGIHVASVIAEYILNCISMEMRWKNNRAFDGIENKSGKEGSLLVCSA